MIDVRNPGDGFSGLRARIRELGPLPGGPGPDGGPLSVAEWAVLIDEIVAHPDRNPEPLWNVATPDEDSREYDAIFIGGGASGRRPGEVTGGRRTGRSPARRNNAPCGRVRPRRAAPAACPRRGWRAAG